MTRAMSFLALIIVLFSFPLPARQASDENVIAADTTEEANFISTSFFQLKKLNQYLNNQLKQTTSIRSAARWQRGSAMNS